MINYYQYHINNAISHQHSAALHADGAYELFIRGLHTTACIWQDLARHHAMCARSAMRFADDALMMQKHRETEYVYVGVDMLVMYPTIRQHVQDFRRV